MSPEKNPLEIYNILPKTNCGQCFLPSCLAFSAAVISGDKKLADCPFIKEVETIKVTPTVVVTEPYEIMRGEDLKRLQDEIAELDISSLAGRVGGKMVGEKLAITCLGKDFLVDRRGRVVSECHTHVGLTIPLLSYIIYSKGDDPTGNWVSFRELKDGPPMNALFEQRGEKRLQRLADNHTDLFDDLVSMFSGTRGERVFASDISVVLYPLPKLPVLICYWKPEEDLGSKLNIFFDATADHHLAIESIFELSIGMVMMFEKIAKKHIIS
jgi:hypothetical protein